MVNLHEENKIDVILRGRVSYASRLWFGYPKEELAKLMAKEIALDNTSETIVKDFLEYAMSRVRLKQPFSSDYLQDAVTLAKLLIRTEIEAQALVEGPDSWSESGGPIRICTITSKHGFKWVL